MDCEAPQRKVSVGPTITIPDLTAGRDRQLNTLVLTASTPATDSRPHTATDTDGIFAANDSPRSSWAQPCLLIATRGNDMTVDEAILESKLDGLVLRLPNIQLEPKVYQ